MEPFEPLHSSLSYGVPTRSQHPSEGPPNSLRQKLLQVGLSGTQGNRLELPCFQEEETEAGDPSLSLPSPASCSLGTSTLTVANAPSAVTSLPPRAAPMSPKGIRNRILSSLSNGGRKLRSQARNSSKPHAETRVPKTERMRSVLKSIF